MAELSIFNVNVKDGASIPITRISKKLESMTQSLVKQKMATQLSADALVRWEAKLAGAGPFQIMQIYQLQRQVQAHKEKQAAEAQALEATISAQKMEAQARSQATQQNISAIDRAAASQKKKQQEDQKAQQATNNLVAALRDEAAIYGMTRDQIDLYRLTQAGATEEQKKAVITAQAQRNDAIKNQKEMQGVTRHLRFMRGGFGQVGYQIQDMAVQAQMGTNSMIILGQQGSQVASLFGPGGAMIGAVLAVVAALSTVLIPNLFGASKAMKKVTDEQKTLIDTFNELDGILKAFGLKAATDEVKIYDKVIADSKKNIAELSESKLLLNRIESDGAAQTEASTNRRKAAFQRINKEINQERVNIAIAEKQRMSLSLATDGFTASSQKLIDKLVSSIATLGMNEQELARFEAEQTHANQAVVDSIVALSEAEAAAKKKKKADEEAAQAIKDNQKAVNDMKDSLAEEILMFGKSAAEIAVRAAELKKATPAEQEAIRLLAEHKQELIDKDKADKKAAETAIENKKSLDDMVLSLADELAQVNMSATAIRVYNAAKLGANEITVEAIRLMGEELAAQELLKTKREDAAKSFADLQISSMQELESPADKIQREYEEKIAKIVEYEALANAVQAEADAERLAAQKIFTDKSIKLHDDIVAAQLAATSSVLSSFQGQISGMAGFLEEGSAIGKAFYVAQQAMAAGMAIIKGYEAAMSIKASMAMMGPVGIAASPALEAAAISMGYVTAAMIAGQTLASFEGGGHVGGRSRSGGMDNKGGVLAMLHPNESVIDHTKGQGGGITIVNNIDASGAGPDVEMKIEKAVKAGNAQTIVKIQDLMRRRRFA
jgi:hypothetical protein